jgi:glutamate N-acetyltransferase/amino-acid N-acetyltransferase
MSAEAAKLLAVGPEEMLVCSTGLIGSYLPIDKVKSGIASAFENLSNDDDSVAQAIMTTDTRPKRSAVRHADGWSVGGIAKGAAMISPNMATMLAFVTTDAVVSTAPLQEALSQAVDVSFNSIVIDGDRSTNDTCLCFANGASEVRASAADLMTALEIVCRSLAEQIVADGEGATKFIRVSVRGAASKDDARRAARHIAESALVKTAMFGGDANWGRVAAAIGQSGVEADYDRLSISIGGFKLLSYGEPAGESALEEARGGLKDDPEPAIECELGVGADSAEIVTTDLSLEYVRLNAAYE